jgi:hypothetical protein
MRGESLQPIPCDKNEFGTVAQARKIFDESFLSIRAKLIEVAAVLDRVDRATAKVATDPPQIQDDIHNDPRRARVEDAIRLLLRGSTQPGERAATLQQLFSREYDPQWRDQFDI